MIIESSKIGDLPQIITVSRKTGVFSEEEVNTVDELFRGYLKSPVESGYNFLTAREGDKVVGYACWGPTALSKGAVDLYWICTASEAQGKGVANGLFEAVKEAARQAGRWIIVIWTSSRDEYQPARSFYLRMGCTQAAQLPDFYDRGEDLCVFYLKL